MGKYDFGNNEEKNEIYKKAVYSYPTRGVFAKLPREVFSVDLVDMTGRPMKGYKYILNCVDVFSRKLFCRILQNKDSVTLKKSFENIFKESGKPVKIWADQEAGWTSNEMKKYFEENKIILYHTYGPCHSSIVERLNRTMKEQIEKNVGDKWLSFVNKFVEVYNKTKHSSIDTTPNEAYSTGKGALTAFHNNVDNYMKPRKETEERFNVGDHVRIQAQKDKFVKGYAQRWSNEIFIIHQVLSTNPTTYKIKDKKGEIIEGSFYFQELQKTNF